MSDEYEGWSNRETWAVNLHLMNNEGDYLAASQRAEELLEEEDAELAATSRMADWIKDWTEEIFQFVVNPDYEFGNPSEEARMFVSDVGSYWRVDFYEIAQHWITDAKETS